MKRRTFIATVGAIGLAGCGEENAPETTQQTPPATASTTTTQPTTTTGTTAGGTTTERTATEPTATTTTSTPDPTTTEEPTPTTSPEPTTTPEPTPTTTPEPTTTEEPTPGLGATHTSENGIEVTLSDKELGTIMEYSDGQYVVSHSKNEGAYACLHVEIENTDSEQSLPSAGTFGIIGTREEHRELASAMDDAVDFYEPVEGPKYDPPDGDVDAGTSESGWIIIDADEQGFGSRGPVNVEWSAPNGNYFWEIEFEW